jgi:hypothetical protein
VNALGFLVTFRPCGHVGHFSGQPRDGWRPGIWVSCCSLPGLPHCQAQRQVLAAGRCPGCPQCPGWAAPVTTWEQPSLFEAAA